LEYYIDQHTLKSVYYRAPTFLRDIFQENVDEEEQLFRTQWTAFVRSLIVFEDVKWVNNPVDTYKAEMKPLQLYYANKVGLKLPHTVASNFTRTNVDKRIAIKSIDTAIINKGDEEAFIYTSIIEMGEMEAGHHRSPFFIQEALIPKTDIRVTIIDDDVIAIKIFSLEGINVDWRKYKGQIQYELFVLPEEIKEKCLALVKLLNLRFGAIDLLIFDNDFYFIEINPTGEWSWLQKNTGFHFDELISKSLQNEK
jgi:glutathione synthase/RimK-type ligase-like ATP-grasp enzyme